MCGSMLVPIRMARRPEGIYPAGVCLASGRLTTKVRGGQACRSLVVAIHPQLQLSTRSNQLDKSPWLAKGAALAVRGDSHPSRELTLLNQQSSGWQSGPCHRPSIGQQECPGCQCPASGSVASLIQADGTLSAARRSSSTRARALTLAGGPMPILLTGPNRFRHRARPRPDAGFVYKLDVGKGTLTRTSPPSDARARSLAISRFTPGARLRLRHQRAGQHSDRLCLRCRPVTSHRVLLMISTLPPSFQGKSYTAEVQVHPSGKFASRLEPRPRQTSRSSRVDPATGPVAGSTLKIAMLSWPRFEP